MSNNSDKNKQNDKKRNNEDANDNEKNKKRKEDHQPINFIRIIPQLILPFEDDNFFEDDINNIDELIEEDIFYNDNEYDEIITKSIETIDDLIELGKLYDPKNPKKKYNINVKKLNDLIGPLTELNRMIGMKNVKQTVVDLIIYYLQDFEKYTDNMMHTVIYGPPGCGKTELANILAKIYCKMGIIKTNKVVKKKRSDLVGEYLGHTAKQTQRAIDEAKDGVLFIDEAYSLGNKELRDSFAKECIDTLNQNLTENKNKFICIIAGYKHALSKCFFAYNEGLERRFPFKFEVDPYTGEDLKNIFIKIVKVNDWILHEDIPTEFFENNINYFKFYGGDMETLFHFTKITHARRVFCLPKKDKKSINYKDVEKAFELFCSDDEVKKRDNKDIQNIYKQLYM